MLHERIIITNESSLKYKEMIFMKFLVDYLIGLAQFIYMS
jgi:hypothetical protein